MREFTNLVWPDDPYHAGQQLYHKPPPMLAAFATLWIDDDEEALPVSAAVVYLRLHRTRPVPLDTGFPFGFRVAAAEDAHADRPEMREVVGLDLLQARRHAAVLAGHSLADDLYGWRAAGINRGIQAVDLLWPGRSSPGRGLAHMVDTAHDGEHAEEDLRQACIRAGVAPGSASHGLAPQQLIADRYASGDTRWLALAAVERALVIALVAGHGTGRCAWSGVLGISQALAAAAWDSFPDLAAVTEETTRAAAHP